MPCRIVNCRWESGEHYRMLVDATTSMPPYWPTLFVSTQLRNTGRSVATMEAGLDAIRVLFGFLDERKIDLEERVLQGEYFATGEIDVLCDQAQLKSRGDGTVSPGLTIASMNFPRARPISSRLFYSAPSSPYSSAVGCARPYAND